MLALWRGSPIVANQTMNELEISFRRCWRCFSNFSRHCEQKLCRLRLFSTVALPFNNQLHVTHRTVCSYLYHIQYTLIIKNHHLTCSGTTGKVGVRHLCPPRQSTLSTSPFMYLQNAQDTRPPYIYRPPLQRVAFVGFIFISRKPLLNRITG